ncbi:unnamed protein product [Meganyctiphanes norvegica]|uniref:Uncharacterized protein n=1 Tax=Meganyctiphanes norvegica TaxID=48144 RepID=A0AAV2RSA4_MEGNR
MCCTIGKSTFKNKEFWYKGEVLYTCEHGTEEKSLNHEGILSLQLPSVPEVLSNDLEMNKRKRRSPADKINCWDQEQALEILCHSWNARCYIKKCHRGQLTYQVDLKCCEIDGVAYPDGVAWSEKCLLYFCDAGAARKQSDASCCSYCGEKYPHGHKWDEEEEDCYEKVCRSGTVKREMKKSCCKHDGEIYRNGEYWQTRNHMWICFDGEKEKVDDSDEYCKFDNKIYRTGEGWIKECAIYTCEKGCISSRMDTACKGQKKCGNECDYDTDDYGLEINEVCASFGGPCTIGQDQGVCRPRCGHGEVPLGQCDGRACICCGPIANGANYIPLLNLNTTNNIDHNTIISGLEINEVCASQGGPCNTEQGQGVCRPSCGPGEVGLGQCDGRACICCGPIANGDNSIPLLSLNTAINIDNNTITPDTQQSCTVDGKILGSGRSIVVQEKCLTYMCNNGILLEAKMENC